MKKFTNLAIALTTLFCTGAANAQTPEGGPITADMFHTWNNWDATAEIEGPADVEYNVGNEIGTGAVLMGTGSVTGAIYADLTEYAGIYAEGTPGVTLRLLLNRPSMDQGGITECQATFDENGVLTFMFSDINDGYPYVHLNAVKTPWGFPEGISGVTVSKFNYIEKQEEPVGPDAEAITGSMWHIWTNWNETAEIEGPANVEDNIGKEVGAGATLLGDPSVLGKIFADLTEYAGIYAEGTPGVTLRLLFNRPDMEGGSAPITERQVTFDENGVLTFMFSDINDGYPYVHLNAVKTPWGFPEGITSAMVTKFNYIEKQEEPVGPDAEAITIAMWHNWTSWGEDAEIDTEKPFYGDDNVGKEVSGGWVLLGTGSVLGCEFADLTEYAGIYAEGTPGVSLRLLFNRSSMEGGSAPISECNPTFDENGQLTFMFTQLEEVEIAKFGSAYPYVHLNCVKLPWGFPEGIENVVITKFNYIEKGTSGVADIISGVAADAPMFNIMGQKVDENYKGIVIKNGKKFINK